MPAEVSAYSDLWKILSRTWDESGLLRRDLPTALAALIYLRWADFQEAELEAIAAFDDTDYAPVLSTGLHWRTWHQFPAQKLQHFFDEQLSSTLERLNNFRHRMLATHLHHIVPAVRKLAHLSPRALSVLTHWLADQPFETLADRKAMLKAFDAVLDKAHDKHLGEFRTPGSVIRLMVALAAPAAGDRIYDPCFGSAGLLKAAYDYTLQGGKYQFTRMGAPHLVVSGVELNRDAYLIGLTRLSLAGIDDPQLELGNSLERPALSNPQKDGFDIVLADPPWGIRAEPAVLNQFAVKTPDVAGLFIQHTLSQLRPEGRAVVVVPQGFMFRSGPEQRLRRLLLEQHDVEAVVALPENTFLPYTAIRAGLLVLRRNGPTKRIRMMDAEPLFVKGKGKQPAILNDDRADDFGLGLRLPNPGQDCWDVDAVSLAEVEWDFTPKRRDRSELDRLLDVLRAEVEIVPLNACCRILSGRSFKKDQLLGEPPSRFFDPGQTSLFPKDGPAQKSIFETPIVPFIRIQDIQKGQAAKGSSWLTPNAASSVNPRWKLKSGDVLLSKSGTIGKTGIVRNRVVGAVAAGGLFILRPYLDRLDPHFLWAYLESHECRTWLDDRARGTTVRSLSKRLLDEMPIPLPPLQIQRRVAMQYRESGTGVPVYLVQLLIEGEDDPIAEWVDEALRVLKSEKGDNLEEADVSELMHTNVLGGRFAGLHNRSAHQDAKKNPLTSWILALTEVVDALRHTDEAPPGPAYYGLLQQAEHALYRAEGLLSGNLPTENKASELTRAIAVRVEKAMAALSGNVRLTITCDIDTLPPGGPATVDVVINNQGPLPLRDVRVSTQPDWGEGKIGYLAEQEEKRITVSGITPKDAGHFSLRVIWAGLAFDGRQVDGEREVAFNLVESETVESVNVPGIGGSPYVTADPVKPERNDVFFGREELLDQIRRQIIQAGNVVILEGNRRAGKSSILWHLAGPNTVPGWLGVYCSLQGAEGSKISVGVPTVEVFREIAISIAKAIQAMGGETPLPNGGSLAVGEKLGIAKAFRKGIGEDSPFSDFREYVEVVLGWLSHRGLGLLLLLDEFEKLQEGIDRGITSPQVPENIRFFVQTYPKFSAILSGGRRLKQLREKYWSALYGIGTRFGVSSLPEPAARRLVTEPVCGRLIYTTEAVDRSIYLTASQPFLLQCLCNRAFDMAAQLKIRSVTIDIVNRAGDVLVEDNEHFATIWDEIETDRRRFILILCHKSASDPDPLQLGVVQEHLLRYGIEVGDESLIGDLESLRQLELLKLAGSITGGRYMLAIPLMGTWIERQQDMAVVLSRARLETED
jgi:type I restriction enzyme M protein